jgi:CheY-like chemotaxis protein
VTKTLVWLVRTASKSAHRPERDAAALVPAVGHLQLRAAFVISIMVATVLLAEDDPEVREILAEALSYAGHQVTKVPDGESALLMLTRAHFDLLLTDVRMPGKLNGFALARETRKLYPGTKIVCATGYATEQASERDCDVLLHKPFSVMSLLKAVTLLLKT